MTTIIDTKGLTKHYGHVHALDGLDLQVEEGQVHGFLGPNGAGKSTTIRILLGLARATGGEASVFGQDPWRDAVALHRRVSSIQPLPSPSKLTTSPIDPRGLLSESSPECDSPSCMASRIVGNPRWARG